MKSVTQKDALGCGVACVAFVLHTSYPNALKLFKENKASSRGYTCKDICTALEKGGKLYTTKYIGKATKRHYKNFSIVYIKKNTTYQYGHYLCKTSQGFMDPFTNLKAVNGDHTQAISGFITKLPGKTVYEIYSLED